MDKLAHYRQMIQQLLSEYASYQPINPDIEQEFICDPERDRYLI